MEGGGEGGREGEREREGETEGGKVRGESEARRPHPQTQPRAHAPTRSVETFFRSDGMPLLPAPIRHPPAFSKRRSFSLRHQELSALNEIAPLGPTPGDPAQTTA